MLAQKLNRPTLVLNKSWTAMGIQSARKSIVKILSGTAKVVDENYVQYDWDEWLDATPFDTKKSNVDDFISSGHYKVKIPCVIVLLNQNRHPNQKVKMTRRNILIRDKFTCQYTGKKLTSQSATLDHVIPHSRGGKSTWDNLVLASVEANVKKANRTPEEAGMKLRTVPKRPAWGLQYTKYVAKVPAIWKKFIDTDKWNEYGYWDVELVE